MFFFFQAEDGIRDGRVTGVQTCALPIFAIPAQIGILSARRIDRTIRRYDQSATTSRSFSALPARIRFAPGGRSEEHTSELSHPSISYAVFCLKKKNERQCRRRERVHYGG